jgi:hypothetical protein
MAGYKAASKAVTVLLGVAALLAAAARAADDDHPWKCFQSCTKACHPDNAAGAANKNGNNVSAVISTVPGKCKSGCRDDDCFEDVPAMGYRQCVYTACLTYPRRMYCTINARPHIKTINIYHVLCLALES